MNLTFLFVAISLSIIGTSSEDEDILLNRYQKVESSRYFTSIGETSSYSFTSNHNLGTNYDSDNSDDSSRVIINDVTWYDNNKQIMETNKGGKITKINNDFYWIGSLPNAQLLIYKSSTLGSNSWTLVKSFDMKEQLPKEISHNELGNCQLHQHPDRKRNYIFCKRRLWFKQININTTTADAFDGDDEGDDFVNDDSNEPNDPTLGTYTLLPIPNDPSSLPGFVFGGESTFQQNNELYLIASRCKHRQPKSRMLFIYKLNDQWTDFESEIVKFRWTGRESPWLMKTNGKYYVFASQTQRWRDSKTYYKQSESMIGLKDVDDHEVVMHPKNTRFIRSMGSQFRYVIQPNDDENEKWIFGGDRYPVEAPNIWDSKYGRHVMVPMNFVNDKPHVYWKKKFDWKTYKYDGDYDNHNHGKHGHGPIPQYGSILSVSKTS